jgi:Xaa-Pro aminopeptidase
MFQIDPVRRALVAAGLDGWLFYDFRGLDPIARRVLGLDRAKAGTRRWFYFIPAAGEPRKLVHAIEPGMLDALPGAKTVYLSWQSLREGLAGILSGAKSIAMQYSPRNDVPYVSRVDAGTVELVRSLGAEVASSADLVQAFDATLTEEQLASHRRAAKFLRGLMDEVFALVASSARAGRSITEKDVASFMVERCAGAGFTHDHLPIVAVNDHAANPHFEVPLEGSAPVKRGDLLLVDVWTKEKAPGSIYADITWTAFVGEKVPEEMAAVFRVVREARDAAVARVRSAFRSGEPIRGCDVDRIARGVIERAGHGERFIHRTGHSIHEDGHGNGANIDDLETHDTRLLLPRTLFSIEPGIYLPGHFGIRSEVDVYHTGSDAEVTGPPHQEEIVPLLGGT